MDDEKSKGYRNKSTRVKTAKGRKSSSTRWLQRQLNDPYVAKAKQDGFRSRAAYKLLEIQDKFSLIKNGQSIVDLGAAPGSWSQILVDLVGKRGRVVGIDLLDIDGIAGLEFIKGDFLSNEVEDQLVAMLPDKVDLVLSDMAANTTGHSQTDHLRTMALCEATFYFADKVLKEGGACVSKTFRGGAENTLLAEIKQKYSSVKHFKPKSSRKESPEMYIVAIGFKGQN